MKNYSIFLKGTALLVGVLVFSLFASYIAFAWIEPGNTPPTCPAGQPGCDAPINVGPVNQSKSGGLTLGTSLASGNGLVVKKGTVWFDGTIGETPVSGTAGTRLMWIPSKSAFRAVTCSIAGCTNSNIGPGSAAFGNSTAASSVNSFASGFFTIADGNNSFASGSLSEALGRQSVAMGTQTYANADYSTTMGRAITISNTGNNSFGIGLNNIPSTITQPNTMAIMGGNVGVGTTAPSTKLEVNGRVKISSTSEGFGTGLSIPNSDMDVGGGFDNVFAIRTRNAGIIAFGNNDSFGSIAKPFAMSINTANNYVGIGTNTPLDKLTVVSNVSGADNSSIAVINKSAVDTKARIRFITDMGEFLIARTSSSYTPWPGASGDAVFNLGGKDPADCTVPLGPDGCPSTNNIRFLTTDSNGVNDQRVVITADGDAAVSTQGKGFILKATDGPNCFRVTVNNAGALSTAVVPCP